MAKKYLTEHNIEYKEVLVDKDQEAYAWLVEHGHRSVPQLYIDNQLLVENGYQGLVALSLQKLKEKVGENVS
jgi:glutaredoxin